MKTKEYEKILNRSVIAARRRSRKAEKKADKALARLYRVAIRGSLNNEPQTKT